MESNIIGIMGAKRSGKDTTANYLAQNYGYTIYSFADPIKRGCMEMFGFTYEQMYGTEEQKEAIDPRWGISGRRMLQIIGTELFQYDIHNHTKEGEFPVGRAVWVRRFKLWYMDEKERNPNLKIAIADMRFPHEADIIHGMGGTVIKVIRPSLKLIDGHASETEAAEVIPDITLINDGTLEDFYSKIESSLNLEKPKNKSVIQILRDSDFVQVDFMGRFEDVDPFELGEIVEGGFPKIVDEDGNEEDLDFENFNVISLTPDKMVVSAGGDWQEGLMFSLVPHRDKLRVGEILAGFEDGMDYDELERILLSE